MAVRRRLPVVAVLFFAVAGCGGGSSDGGDEQAVRHVVDDYLRAAISRSPERACDLVSDRVLRQAAGAVGANGRADCRRNANGLRRDAEGQVRDARVLSVKVSGSVASTDVAVELPQGTVTQTFKLRRQADGWKVDDVGVPGDRIAIKRGRVIRNGIPDTFKITPCRGSSRCNFPRAITVAPGNYFMVGDNRGASDDSRDWGPVPLKAILGRVRG